MQPVQSNYSDWLKMIHSCGEPLTWRIYHNGVYEVPQFYTSRWNGFCTKCPSCGNVLRWPEMHEQQATW